MTKRTRQTKPKCTKGTACGYSCISGKLTCSSRILERDAAALVKAATETKDTHRYTASILGLGQKLKAEGMSWDEARAEVLQAQVSDLTRLTKLTPDEIKLGIEAITAYANADYQLMRETDAGIVDPMRDAKDVAKYKKQVNDMNALTSQLPKYEGSVSRGLKFRSERQRDEFVQSLASGFETQGMSSYSSELGVAESFSGSAFSPKTSVLMHVKANKSGVSILPFTEHKREFEVIVPSGTKYKVLSKTTDADGRTVLDLEELT